MVQPLGGVAQPQCRLQSSGHTTLTAEIGSSLQTVVAGDSWSLLFRATSRSLKRAHMALLQSMQSPAQSSSSLKRTAPKSPVAAGEPLVTGSPQLRCKPFDASPHRWT
eukprot:5817370-Amphidinium_carterae.2